MLLCYHHFGSVAEQLDLPLDAGDLVPQGGEEEEGDKGEVGALVGHLRKQRSGDGKDHQHPGPPQPPLKNFLGEDTSVGLSGEARVRAWGHADAPQAVEGAGADGDGWEGHAEAPKSQALLKSGTGPTIAQS